jgi:hypothetical protein
MKAERTTVDLSAYPDLVVIYLGMRVNSLRGLKTLASFGPQIRDAVAAQTRWPFAARRPDFFAVANSRRNAPVLARF